MPASPKQSSKPKNILVAIALVALIGGSAARVWWYRPANDENRYRRMSQAELKQLVDSEPGNAAAWKQMALRLARTADVDSAEPAIRKALELSPDDAELATELGRLCTATGRDLEAYR